MLDTNESLISLDLRENPGFNLPLSKEIFDKLVRNIKYFKETRMKEQSENNMVKIYKTKHIYLGRICRIRKRW